MPGPPPIGLSPITTPDTDPSSVLEGRKAPTAFSSNDVSNRVSFVARLSDPSAKAGRSIAPSGRRSIAVNRSDAAGINAFFKLVMVNLQVGFLIIVNSVY